MPQPFRENKLKKLDKSNNSYERMRDFPSTFQNEVKRLSLDLENYMDKYNTIFFLEPTFKEIFLATTVLENRNKVLVRSVLKSSC